MKNKLLKLCMLIFSIGLLVACNQSKEDTMLMQDTNESGGIKEVRKKNKSLAILIMGIDTGEYERSDQGRSDVMMVALMNQSDPEVELISIPRDTYTEIVGYGTQDKINHAYAFGGPEMAVATVNNLLDIDLDYYIAADMHALINLVDQVGGVEVVPPSSFSIDGYDFTAGQAIRLDGQSALAYVRERYDSGGDYARQDRQRQLIQAIVTEMVKDFSLTSAPKLMKALGSGLETNIKTMQLLGLAKNYRHLNGNFEIEQLQGHGTILDDGIYYDIPDEDSLAEIKTVIYEKLSK